MLLSFSYTDNKETNQQIDRTRISHVVIANRYNGSIAIYIYISDDVNKTVIRLKQNWAS